MALLHREISNILVPSVDVLEDKAAFKQLFAIHCEKKLLLQDLITGGVDHEEVLEALEIYIGTSKMDAYIDQIEPEMDCLFSA